MRGLVCAVAMLALAGTAATAGAAAAPDTKQVSAQGCVQAGIEDGCLVVKDAASGKLYNLLFKLTKPSVGTGIVFTGVPYDGVTTCMQGTPVQITTWSRKDSLQCGKGRVRSVQ